MVALNDRRKLQQIPPSRWEFQFPSIGGKAYVWDNVEVREVKLHAGLKVIVVLEGNYGDDSENVATSLTDRILDIFSFAAVAQSDAPRLISHISIDEDGTSVGTFFQTPNPDSTIVNGTPRTINEDIFKAVWKACDGNQAEQRVLLALQWFRNAIREKYIINQFISYWIALEIANSTFRNILKTKSGKKSPKWGPAIDMFTTKIKSVDFGAVKRARNYILHGNEPLSPEFIARIRTYIVPIRNTLVYLVGGILALDDTITDSITSNTTRRLFLDSSVGLKGNFENLPTDINELLEHYPELITKGKPNRYSIRDTGELDIDVSTDYTAKLPAKTIFNADAWFVVGEENAGIIGISKAALSDK
jgi:hypothetical protein